MTLLKPEVQEEKLNNQDMMKMEKFKQLVKENADFFKKQSEFYFDKALICVATGKGKCNNPYVKFVAEYIFDSVLHIPGKGQERLFFNCKENNFSDSTKNEINRLLTWHFFGKDYYDYVDTWRDDIGFFINNSNYFSAALSKCLKRLDDVQYFSSDKSIFNDEYIFYQSQESEMPEVGVFYMIFWNLFLTAIDDEIYNNQLSDVIDLAYILGFDEPMIRDWCRAVEYVLSGNKLGKDCDLEVETVEGNFFFKSDSLEDFFSDFLK